MATYRVGARVRLVRGHPKCVGLIGTVARVFGFEFPAGTELRGGSTSDSSFNCAVEWDIRPGGLHAEHTDDLEPILPDKSATEHFRELMEKIEFGTELVA